MPQVLALPKNFLTLLFCVFLQFSSLESGFAQEKTSAEVPGSEEESIAFGPDEEHVFLAQPRTGEDSESVFSGAEGSSHPLESFLPQDWRGNDRNLFGIIPTPEEISRFLSAFIEYVDDKYQREGREAFLDAVRARSIAMNGPRPGEKHYVPVKADSGSEVDRRRGRMELVKVRTGVVVVRFLVPETNQSYRAKRNRMELWFYDLPLEVNEGEKLDTDSRYWKREIFKSLLDPNHNRHVMTLNLDPDSESLEGAFYEKRRLLSVHSPVRHAFEYAKTWWTAKVHKPKLADAGRALFSATFQALMVEPAYRVSSALFQVQGDYNFMLGPTLATWSYCFILGLNHRTYDNFVSGGRSLSSEIFRRMLLSAPLLLTVAAMKEGSPVLLLMSTYVSIFAIEVGDKLASSVMSKWARFRDKYGLNRGDYPVIGSKIFWEREVPAWLRMFIKMAAVANDTNPDSSFPYLGKLMVATMAPPMMIAFLLYTKFLETRRSDMAFKMRLERRAIVEGLNPVNGAKRLAELCQRAYRTASDPRRRKHFLGTKLGF